MKKMVMAGLVLYLTSIGVYAQEIYKVTLLNVPAVTYEVKNDSKLLLSNSMNTNTSVPKIELELNGNRADVTISGKAVKQFETESLERQEEKEITQLPGSSRQYNTEQYGLVMAKVEKSQPEKEENTMKTAQKYIVEQEFKLPKNLGETIVVNFNDPKDTKTPENFKNKDLVKIERIK